MSQKVGEAGGSGWKAAVVLGVVVAFGGGFGSGWAAADGRSSCARPYGYLSYDARAALAATTDPHLINGEAVPGVVAESNVTLTDYFASDGIETTMWLISRAAGYRTPIHVHLRVMNTCLMSGSITNYVEGSAPVTYTGPVCYQAPPFKKMASLTIGDTAKVEFDIFTLPNGAPDWVVVEPGYTEEALGTAHSEGGGYGKSAIAPYAPFPATIGGRRVPSAGEVEQQEGNLRKTLDAGAVTFVLD